MRTIGIMKITIKLKIDSYYECLNILNDCLEFDTEEKDIESMKNILLHMEKHIKGKTGEVEFSHGIAVNFANFRNHIKLLNECLDGLDNFELIGLRMLLEAIQNAAVSMYGFTKLEVYGDED